MSLINRMLRDLSERESAPPRVLSGVQVTGGKPAGRRGGRRLVLLLVLVIAFTGAFWALFMRKLPVPVAEPPSAESQAPAVAAAPAPRFQLDAELTATPSASAPAAPPARPRAPKAEAPATLELDASLQRTPKPARSAQAERPAPRAGVRDERAAEARHREAAGALTRGEPRTAEQGFREALALNPRHHAAREALVVLLLDQARFDEAQALLDEGVALASDRVAFRRLGARLDLARGQPGRALLRLEASPPSVAADPEYHGLLGSAYQRLARHEEAARVYQGLTQLQPAEPHWWAAYGLSRDALGDRAGALAAYAQARQLGGLDPRVLEHINRRTAALQASG
jgi:MSHA biogenesis protein MshN